MITHTDEILQSAVSTDATAVPRYNLVRPDGTVVERNIALKLANAIAREGTPVNKPLLDEFLAASGVTAGSGSAYTLAQEGYELFDGAPVRFQLHTASSDGATLNINGTGAKPVVDMMGEAMAGGIPAGTWLTAMYSAAAGAYVLAGGEAVQALYGERYAVDDAVAYVKEVPEDALPYAEVGEVGGMTYKVNVGTEEAPVYELRSAAVTEVESVGVNLLDHLLDTEFNYGGINGITNHDQSITLNGSNSADNVYIRLATITGMSGTYRYTGCPLNGSASGYLMTIERDGSSVFVDYGDGVVASFDENETYKFYIRIAKGYVMNNITFKPMLSKGATALPYRPYVRNTLPIPEAVRALDGYGWGVNDEVYNYIDWKKKQFVKRVEKLVLDGSDDEIWIANSDGLGGYLINVSKGNYTDVLSNKYKSATTPWSQFDTVGVTSQGVLWVCTQISTLNEWKELLANEPLVVCYKLATPIITDISSLLPADNILPIEAGGTITAVNEHGYAVPTTITYQRNTLANRASTYAIKKLRLALELLASIDYVDEAIKPLATSEAVTAAIAAAIAPLATTAALNAAVAPLAKSNLSNASGTFAGAVKANADAAATLGTAQVRNVTISATDLTAGSSALATGDSYHVYS